jgi:mono/diheme cytochrome c family protein
LRLPRRSARRRETRRAGMNHVRLLASIAAGSVLLSATAMAQADPKKVERAWKAKCSSCHGAAGKGDTEKGQQMKIADMTTADFQAKKDDELKNAILNGVKKEKGGVKQEMDAFKGDLTPEQVDALIAYIRTFKK